MVKQFTCPQNEFGIEVLPFEQLVHIATIAAHFLGKPGYAITLSAQLIENHFAKMDIVHGQTACFFARLTPQCRNFIVLFYGTIKKKARESCPCLSRHSGSRIALRSKISNTEAHAHNNTFNKTKDAIDAMDVSHCFTVRTN